ncbi:MAG: efflux transporter outer membrane subunit [Chitinivibrionales bacterium]|nr:efflux transporter outer membrane subunit [Chitinivibrionales bacterium]
MRNAVVKCKAAGSAAVIVSMLCTFACVGPRYHTRIDEYISYEAAYDSVRIGRPPPLWIEHPEIDSLISRTFARNPDILTAWARVEQARAAAGLTTANLLPSVNASATASRTKTTGVGSSLDPTGGQQQAPLGGGAPQPQLSEQTTHVNQFQGSLAASYEVDLWGKLWRRRFAAVQEADAARFDAHAMSISITARVTDTWLMIVAQRQTVDLLENQLDVSKRFAELIELRFTHGMAPASDMVQQNQQVESIRGRLELAKGRMRTLEHQLAILLGRIPNHDVAVKERSLPQPPELPIDGVPVDLLELRPDIQSAWLRLKAADARAAGALFEMLPSLRLSANLFSNADEIAELFEEWLWSISASASQPLFTGGRLIAGYRQVKASAEAQYYAYLKSTLAALKEVRDALVLIRRQESYMQSLSEQVSAAQKALRLSRERYAQGALPYLQVLTSLQSLQQIQQNRIEAQRQLLSYHVQLYRAMGGGSGASATSPTARKDDTHG